MRHAVFIAPGQLEWRETPTPRLQGDCEAIVRPIVVGRCDLDTLYVTGRMPLASGEPIGHEIIGEVVELGAGVRRVRIGQRVIVAAQISCGACVPCTRGLTGRCAAVPFGASYGMGRAGNFGGGLADLVRVPFADSMLVPIPDDTDATRMIGLADMATDAWRAVGPALKERAGAAVLIMAGATPVIALYAVGMARALGASIIHYVDPDAARRQIAKRFGAEAYADTDACDERYEVLVDASADAALLLKTLEHAAPEAIVTSVAPPLAGPTFPLRELYMKGLTYKIGRPNCRSGHDGALHAWSACGFDPALVQPLVRPFDTACETWCEPAVYVAVTRDA